MTGPYVAVRQAGPHHDTPGAWIRMDLQPHTVWKPRPSMHAVANLVSSRISGRGITAGVVDLTTGKLVWTNDPTTPVAPTPPASAEQLDLAI